MNATLEETQKDLPRLVRLARQGEEVVITDNGEAVARITAVAAERAPAPEIPWEVRKHAWLARADAFRASIGTGMPGATIQEILDDDRNGR